MLLAASLLLFLIGVAHSYLGERYVLVRLFRKNDLPHLYGGQWFTKQTLRFAWHITTLAWWGFSFLLLHIHLKGDISVDAVLLTTAVVFGLSGVVALVYSKAKHFSWLVFFAVSSLVLYAMLSRSFL